MCRQWRQRVAGVAARQAEHAAAWGGQPQHHSNPDGATSGGKGGSWHAGGEGGIASWEVLKSCAVDRLIPHMLYT